MSRGGAFFEQATPIETRKVGDHFDAEWDAYLDRVVKYSRHIPEGQGNAVRYAHHKRSLQGATDDWRLGRDCLHYNWIVFRLT